MLRSSVSTQSSEAKAVSNSSTSEYSTSICQWPLNDRPRERLAKYGVESLSDSELLAILVRTGGQGFSAVDLGRRIVRQFGTFREMGESADERWLDIPGIGPAKIAQIRAAIEIGRRYRENQISTETRKVSSSEDIARLLMPRMRDLKREIFKVVYLNASNHVIDIVDEAKGTVNFATPIVREIMHAALRRHAVSIICAHNHPSGEPSPSREDQQFTRKIIDAGKLMHVRVLDHIIIGNDCYYSFADQKGML